MMWTEGIIMVLILPIGLWYEIHSTASLARAVPVLNQHGIIYQRDSLDIELRQFRLALLMQELWA